MKLNCKVFIAVILALCSIYSSCIYGFAAAPPETSPQYVGLSSAGSGLTISAIGYASCYSFVSAATGYTSTLKMSLYQNGTLIKSWSTSGSGRIVLDKGYFVASGHVYQVIATITVKDIHTGYVVDSTTVRSQTQNY